MDDAALHKTLLFWRAAGASAEMNAPLPPMLHYPYADAPAPGTSREVAPGIHWLRMPLPFALDHINLWLVGDGATWTQIDCGYGNAPTRQLWQAHFAGILAGKPLARVVATHYHPDHLGNAAWLATHFACPVVMPQAEYLTAHAIAGEHSGYGPAPMRALLRAHGLSEEHMAALDARGNSYRRGVPELPSHFQRLAPYDEIRIGANDWRVIPGYGHSPEHASLYCKSLAVCISGDMLLPRISTNVSVWPVEPDGDPLRRFLDSLTPFAELPGETLILPSHGLPFVGAGARVGQLREHHAARLAELETTATTPKSAAGVVPVLFRRELDVQQRFFAMGEAIAHLNYLWHRGRLERLLDGDGSIRFVRASGIQ